MLKTRCFTFVLNVEQNKFLKSGNRAVKIRYWLGWAVMYLFHARDILHFLHLFCILWIYSAFVLHFLHLFCISCLFLTQHITCIRVLQCVAVYCSVLQCVAVYCSVLQRVAVTCKHDLDWMMCPDFLLPHNQYPSAAVHVPYHLYAPLILLDPRNIYTSDHTLGPIPRKKTRYRFKKSRLSHCGPSHYLKMSSVTS